MFLQRTRPWGRWGGRAGGGGGGEGADGGKGGGPHSFMTQERQIGEERERACSVVSDSANSMGCILPGSSVHSR